MRNQFPETPLDAALLSMPQYVASSPLRATTRSRGANRPGKRALLKLAGPGGTFWSSNTGEPRSRSQAASNS